MQNYELQIQNINGTMSEMLDRLKSMVTNAILTKTGPLRLIMG